MEPTGNENTQVGLANYREREHTNSLRTKRSCKEKGITNREREHTSWLDGEKTGKLTGNENTQVSLGKDRERFWDLGYL